MENGEKHPSGAPGAVGDGGDPTGTAHATDGGSMQQGVDSMNATSVSSLFSSIFATQPPKHALEGLSNGACNAGTGVLLGLSSLVAATASGVAEEGAWGGAKGLGKGFLGMIALSTYGAVAGATQIARGVYNTCEAVSQLSKGDRYWDSNRREWVQVHLQEEFNKLAVTDDDIHEQARAANQMRLHKAQQACEGVANEGAQTAEGYKGSSDSVSGAESHSGSLHYYKLLGVSQTATPAEIRKAFTARALRMHPDKNPTDPNATLKFQELMTAYNTLSVPATRNAYDLNGTVDSTQMQQAAVNPLEELLGADRLEPLAGRLQFLRYFQNGGDYDDGMLKELHHRRRLRIAQHLCHYLDDEVKGFDDALIVLRDALSTRLGPTLVSYVAEAYYVVSRQHLHNNGFLRELDSFSTSKLQSISHIWDVSVKGLDAMMKAYRKKLGEDTAMELLAVAVESDVRRAVTQACRLVVFDASVDEDARNRRARRLADLAGMAMHEVRTVINARTATQCDASSGEAAP